MKVLVVLSIACLLAEEIVGKRYVRIVEKKDDGAGAVKTLALGEVFTVVGKKTLGVDSAGEMYHMRRMCLPDGKLLPFDKIKTLMTDSAPTIYISTQVTAEPLFPPTLNEGQVADTVRKFAFEEHLRNESETPTWQRLQSVDVVKGTTAWSPVKYSGVEGLNCVKVNFKLDASAKMVVLKETPVVLPAGKEENKE